MLEDTELWSLNFSVTFPDGSISQTLCTTIPIKNDMELEGDHDFTVDIISAGSLPHAETVAPSSTRVIIKDDERKSLLTSVSHE